jgi:hypothetical protein
MGIGLPDNGSYVEASWEVDWDVIEDASYGKACEERLK